MLETICQILIPVTGVPALFLLTMKKPRPRAAVLLAIIGQPFWYITAYTDRKWGIIVINLFYSANWIYGLWLHWIKPWRARRA